MVNSNVPANFLFGFSVRENQHGPPSTQQFAIDPVLGQWTVKTVPSINFISAKNLL